MPYIFSSVAIFSQNKVEMELLAQQYEHFINADTLLSQKAVVIVTSQQQLKVYVKRIKLKL